MIQDPHFPTEWLHYHPSLVLFLLLFFFTNSLFDLSDSVPYSIEKLSVILALCVEIQGSFCEIQESSSTNTYIDQPQSFEFTQVHPFNMRTEKYVQEKNTVH